jgi:hypothetical protein
MAVSRGATAQSDFSRFRRHIRGRHVLSGALVESFGSHAYLAMSLTAAPGLVIALAGRRAWREADRA